MRSPARAPSGRYGPVSRGALTAELVPRSPFRLPSRRWPDGVARTRDGVYERYLHVDGCPVLVRAWEVPRERKVVIAAMPMPPGWIEDDSERDCADAVVLERAIDRARNALGVDDDLSEFHARFKRDPLLGPLISRRPHLRPRRAAHAWEALAWAVTEQLIEAQRAHVIQRRIIGRWGTRAWLPHVNRPLRDVPGPEVIAGVAPAELAAMDLAPKRAIALIKVAREIAAGRCDPASPDGDRRLGSISNIGPWTLQCLGLNGRGELDSLPAGDLAYVKLVPRLTGMDRRATVEEVEEFYARFAPYRGIAGLLTLSGLRTSIEGARPLRYYPASPELEAA